jgi:hypothetical protein
MKWLLMDSLAQLTVSVMPLKQIRVPDVDIKAIEKFTFDDANVIQSHKTLVANRKCLMHVLKVTDAKLRQADRFIKNATTYKQSKKKVPGV